MPLDLKAPLWRIAALALALGLILGGLVGWKLHTPPPAPAVHAEQQAHAEADRAAAVDTATHEGPKRTVHLDFDPVPRGAKRPSAPVLVPGLGAVQAPPGERLESVTIEDEGPRDVETHATEQEHHEADTRQVVTVAPPPPAPLPRWSLGVGIDDALGARSLRLSGGLRVVGPIWAELAVVPARRELGAALRVTF